MNIRAAVTLSLFACAAGLLAGCGPERKITLSYDRPAVYSIPDTIRSIGVAEFGGQTAEDKRWGDIASDRLIARLEKYNRKYDRYQLVDRKRLAAILDEQDLQLAISDTASAETLGKLAKVDAMIYGTVHVNHRDERATRKSFDPLSRSLKTVSYTRRFVMVSVNFTMDAVNTGRTLASVSAVREYDSDKDKDKSKGESVGKVLGFSGDNPPPTDSVVGELIDQCVGEFIVKISPHEVKVVEKLRRTKSKIGETGNKLAEAGDHAEALEYYQAAIDADPADHEAVFNAGVMHEAMGNLSAAEQHYDRAFRMEPEEQYIHARRRVRQENGS